MAHAEVLHKLEVGAPQTFGSLWHEGASHAPCMVEPCHDQLAGGGLIQARHLHVTVSEGFSGGGGSFGQACLHVHRTLPYRARQGSFYDLTNNHAMVNHAMW